MWDIKYFCKRRTDLWVGLFSFVLRQGIAYWGPSSRSDARNSGIVRSVKLFAAFSLPVLVVLVVTGL